MEMALALSAAVFVVLALVGLVLSFVSGALHVSGSLWGAAEVAALVCLPVAMLCLICTVAAGAVRRSRS